MTTPVAARRRRKSTAPVSGSLPGIFSGGAYKPLTEEDCARITEAALDILEQVGFGETPPWLADRLVARGAKRSSSGRIRFPRNVVERALKLACSRVDLPGAVEDRGLTIGGGRVHIGTGGAAVQCLDDSGSYRDSTLADLYRMMRVVDASEFVHYGVRPLVARDMPTPKDLDINTAYACLRGTAKPIGISFNHADHVPMVCRLFDLALQRDDGFRLRPFCMAVIVHTVSPLRFAPEGVAIMRAAIEAGMTPQICTAGQAGATSPAALAGALAQGLAESLAGLMVVDAIKPGHPCIYAFMPFISDLRTGAMTGGGGESAVANAAAAQLLGRLDLPSTVSAGMTDAKQIDAQAGYEKGYSVALAANAGADMINLSVGMLGSIMVASPEALAIDNDMCGAILRTVRGVEVSDALLDIDMIRRVVDGDGHYLGAEQTLELMRSEYQYPNLGDRQSVAEWVDGGSVSLQSRAHSLVETILTADPPDHLSPAADLAIRDEFDIRMEG